MKISEYIAANRDDYGSDDQGNLTIAIGSNMLTNVTVDTYSTFTGDSWQESEVDHFSSDIGNWFDHTLAHGKSVDFDWEDIDFKYNFQGILSELADSMATSVIENVYGITDYKIISTYSPGAYNFATDSFNADWTIDIEEMIEEYGDKDIADIEARAQEEYGSRSGFISYIPDYFEIQYPWAILWAFIDQILSDNFDGLFMEVFDDEHEIYMNNVDIEFTESAYRKAYEAITGQPTPDTVTDEDSLTDALPVDYKQDEVLF